MSTLHHQPYKNVADWLRFLLLKTSVLVNKHYTEKLLVVKNWLIHPKVPL